MFCSKCGAELAQDASFCSKCGQAVKAEAARPPAQVAYDFCRIIWDFNPFGGLIPKGRWIAELDDKEIARSDEVGFKSQKGNRELVAQLATMGWEPMGSDDRGNITVLRRPKAS